MSSYVPTQSKTAITYNSPMVSTKILNQVPTLMAQAPNRKGNVSNMPPSAGSGRMDTVGVTNVSSNKVNIAQPKGNQGAPSASGTVHGGNGKSQVKLARPEGKYEKNCGYLNESKPWKA